MRQLYKYILVSIFVILFSSCENLEPELYKNGPAIQKVDIVATPANESQLQLEVRITLNKDWGESINVEFGNFYERSFWKTNIPNVYLYNFYISAEDFDEIDYNAGVAYLRNTNIVVKSSYENKVLAVRNIASLRYEDAPSITLTEVTVGDTEYDGSSNQPYTTKYTGWYKITGSIFLREAYSYLLGNWSKPGKNSNISKYTSDIGKTGNSFWITYGYSFDGCCYNQFRADTKSGKTLIADKTICITSTHSGDVNIYLVNSSSVSATNTRATNATAENSTRNENAEVHILHNYTIDKTPIKLIEE